MFQIYVSVELIKAAHNKGIGAIRADRSILSIFSLLFFSFRLTVFQLKLNFNCKFRSLICSSTGRTQHLFPSCANTVRWLQFIETLKVMKSLILLFTVLFFSCNETSTKSSPIKKAKDSLADARQPKYLPDPTNTLEKKVQKLELEYILWGCACANWVTLSDYKKYSDSGLATHCIFIEPADTTKNFPDSIFQFDKNNLLVIGQFYIKEDYPKGTFETEEKLEKAKVFRYTSLKVIAKKDN